MQEFENVSTRGRAAISGSDPPVRRSRSPTQLSTSCPPLSPPRTRALCVAPTDRERDNAMTPADLNDSESFSAELPVNDQALRQRPAALPQSTKNRNR